MAILRILTLGATLATADAASDPLHVWRVLDPIVATKVDLMDIAYGAGVFVVVGWGGLLMVSADGETWTALDDAAEHYLLCVRWIEDHFLISDQSAVIESADGWAWSNWRPADTPGPDGPNLQAYGDSYYVSVRNCGPAELRVSRDGVTWERQSLEWPSQLRAVAYGQGRFLVVGHDGTILLSDAVPPVTGNLPPRLNSIPNQAIDELQEWRFRATAQDPDPGQTLTFRLAPRAPAGLAIDVASGEMAWCPDEWCGPGQHDVGVVVGDDGEPPLYDVKWFAISVAEVNQPPVFPAFPGIVLDRETTVVIEATDFDSPLNQLRYDLDSFPEGVLLNLTTRQFLWKPTKEQLGQVHAFRLRVTDDGAPPAEATAWLEVLSQAEVWLSLEPDPLTRWQVREVPEITAPTRRIFFLNERFFILGDAGLLLQSEDGLKWSRIPTGVDTVLRAMAYDENRGFVLVGEQGSILHSPDGEAWKRASVETSETLVAAAFGAGRFVAVGGSPSLLFTSTNGKQWTAHGNLPHESYTADVIWDGDQFLAIGGTYGPPWESQVRTMLRSSDGLTWFADDADGIGLHRLVRGIDRTVAVGRQSYLWTSWGASEMSLDGHVWTPQSTMALHDVAYGDGRFMALGAITGKHYGLPHYLVSRDGVHWQEHSWGNLPGPGALAFGKGRFIALSDYSPPPFTGRVVLVSGPTINPEGRTALRPDRMGWSGFEVRAYGQAGHVYRVEVSGDLRRWRTLGRVEGGFWGPTVTDSEALSRPAQLYRMVQEE